MYLKIGISGSSRPSSYYFFPSLSLTFFLFWLGQIISIRKKIALVTLANEYQDAQGILGWSELGFALTYQQGAIVEGV